MEIELNIEFDQLAWFKNSPDAGDPDCVCSYCGFVIQEDDLLYRLYRKSDPANVKSKSLEARLHNECFQLLLK